MLTVLAALFVPITGAIVYFGFWTINLILRTCTDQTYNYSGSIGNQHYTVCTNPGATWIIPLLIIAPFLVLSYLYARVHIKNPLKRATLVTALIAIAFMAEFFVGAALILTGVGGIVYLIMVPIVVGWITVWYHRHIGKEVSDVGVAPSVQAAYPPQVQSKEHHDEESKTTEKPPQQNPPTTSTQ